MTVEYAKTRQQFGAAIGSFQAIQQKIAQCYAHSESLTSLSQFASWSAAHSPHQRTLTSQAAILAATEFGPMICETAIQAHGGIGFTWEYDLHLYLRRAKLIEAAFGLNEDRARALVDTVATS
jgi:alkylation response protein AidB-like acyl-CoA dehydrogenase